MSNVKSIDRQTFLNRAKEMFGNEDETVALFVLNDSINNFLVTLNE